MNLEKVCYGCFREKGPGICPYCGYDDTEEQPFLALPAGTILNGRYMTGKVLGVGGFGITYLGYDLTLEIKVAIKEYMPSGMATRYKDGYTVTLTGRVEKEYAAGMERFLDEARILAKLQNLPNIVSVQNYFKENNTAYFVMEYIEGMSLKEYIAEHGGSIPYTEALAILLPVMEALCEVHSLNLMHRDISPDNIYITASGESRLLDFGAARFSMGDNKSVSVILKHGYAPEEQYSSHGNQGPWTDIYAMGATLYRCVTGTIPPDSIERIHNDTLKTTSELGAKLPAPMEAAIMKALSVKAEDRYPNMRAFIDALSGKKAISVTERVTAGVTERAAGVTVAADHGSGIGFLETMKKNPLVRWLIVGAAAAILVFAVIFPAAGVYSRKNTPITSNSGMDAPAATQELAVPGTGGSTPVTTPETSAPVTTPETGSVDAEMTTHEIAGYGAEISVPSDWTEDAESWVFTSPDSRMALGVDLYYYQPYMACYSIEDIESNVEAVAAQISEEMGATGYEIRTAGPQQIGGAPAYQIDLRATKQTGGEIDVVLLFTETQNDFGLYYIMGACTAGDEQAYSTLRGCMDTFTVTGPDYTTFKLYSNEELGFKFLYDTDYVQEEPAIVNVEFSGGPVISCVTLYPATGDETQFVEIENVSAIAATAQEASDFFYNSYINLGMALNEPYTDMWGGVEWTMWEGTVQSSSVAFGAAEINGQIYVVAGSVQEANAEAADSIRRDAMSSLRPV